MSVKVYEQCKRASKHFRIGDDDKDDLAGDLYLSILEKPLGGQTMRQRAIDILRYQFGDRRTPGTSMRIKLTRVPKEIEEHHHRVTDMALELMPDFFAIMSKLEPEEKFLYLKKVLYGFTIKELATDFDYSISGMFAKLENIKTKVRNYSCA